jgi:hypothetical protein
MRVLYLRRESSVHGLANSTPMLKRVATAIAIVVSAFVVILAVAYLVAIVRGDFTILAMPPTAAVIAGLLVIPAYAPAQRKPWRFLLWMAAAALSSLLSIAFLAVRIAWRRAEIAGLEARTPA